MLMSTRQKLLLLKRLYLISSQTVGTENVYMNFMLLLVMSNKYSIVYSMVDCHPNEISKTIVPNLAMKI